jgi:hypothetical protein
MFMVWLNYALEDEITWKQMPLWRLGAIPDSILIFMSTLTAISKCQHRVCSRIDK